MALGVGLLIGAERERRKQTGPNRGAAGIRTFTVSSMLGAISLLIGGATLLAVTALIVGAGALLAYQKTRDQDPGMTTEFALLLTCLLGGLAMRDAVLAAGVGTVLTLLLAGRNRMHHFVRSVLTEQELNDIILFSAMALIALPLAPDRFLGPFAAINPHGIARLIVLVMAVSALGYVAMRSLGPRYGLPLAGFASGFVSSAATIYSLGERAAKKQSLVRGAAVGAVFSSIATMIQMATVIALVHPALLGSLLLPLGMGGLAACLYGGFIFSRLPTELSEPRSIDGGRAFDLKTAATFAALVSAVLLLTAGLNDWLGPRGNLLGAALTGLVDAHATAASVASLLNAHRISAQQAVGPILLGLSSNTAMKAVLAFKSGGARYAAWIVPGLLFMIAAVWLGAWLS